MLLHSAKCNKRIIFAFRMVCETTGKYEIQLKYLSILHEVNYAITSLSLTYKSMQGML